MSDYDWGGHKGSRLAAIAQQEFEREIEATVALVAEEPLDLEEFVIALTWEAGYQREIERGDIPADQSRLAFLFSYCPDAALIHMSSMPGTGVE